MPITWIICCLIMHFNIVGGNQNPFLNISGEKINTEDVYHGKQVVADVLKKYFDCGIKVCNQYQKKQSKVLTELDEEFKALDQTVASLVNEFNDDADLENIQTHAIQPLTNFFNDCVRNSRSFHVQSVCLDTKTFFPKMIKYFQTDIRSAYFNLMKSTFFTISSLKNMIGLHLNLAQEFALILPLAQRLNNQSDDQCNVDLIAQTIITSTVQIINDMKTTSEEDYFTTKNFERFFAGQARDSEIMFEMLMTAFSDKKDPNGIPYNYSVSLGFPLTFSYQKGTVMTEDVNFVKITGGFIIRDSGSSSANCLSFKELHTEKEWLDYMGKIVGTRTPIEGAEVVDLVGHHYYSYGCKAYKFFVLREVQFKSLDDKSDCNVSKGSMNFDWIKVAVWNVAGEDTYVGMHCLEIIYL